MTRDTQDGRTEQCPECGSGSVTQKGVKVSADDKTLAKHWDKCLNCGWSEA